MKKLTLTEFLRNFYERYPSGLDLDLTEFEYVTAKTKSKTRCKIHDIEIANTADALMSGIKRCSKCKSDSIKQAQTYSLELCLEKFRQTHGSKYNYSLVEYSNIKEKVKIICPDHGIFEQNPQSHWNGHGCTKPGCGYQNLRRSVDDFVDEATSLHNGRYDYSDVKYVNNYTAVKIKCFEHGVFEMPPKIHIFEQRGCPSCFLGNRSWLETSWLDSINVPYDCRQKRLSCGSKNFLVDAKIGNRVYEFWGDFWHGNPKVFVPTDRNRKNGKTFGELYQKTQEKRKRILESGYELVEIWEDDYVQQYNQRKHGKN